jgi:2-phospho-L-lactate guanylyltransferase
VKPSLLVPVKDHARAKLRMAPLLDSDERTRLAWAMFEDVARALAPLHEEVSIVLVTSSAHAAQRAGALGWRILEEDIQISESASVDRACRLLAAEGAAIVLRVPADLPLLEPDDVMALLAAAPAAPGTVLVPSRDLEGTNALLRTPPHLFPSRFGTNSLLLHRQEAARAGAAMREVRNARLELDLDDADDVLEFLRRARRGETLGLLEELKAAERMAPHAR